MSSLLAVKLLPTLCVFITIICGVSNGEVYEVGGLSGWTNIGHLYYKSWAASNNFHVGDTIVFKYNKQFHNVVRVTHKNFNGCNATTPYATWATGNDSFTIKNPGHFYFICGVPGHCRDGQRVDIRVQKAHIPGPAPSPLHPGQSPKSPEHLGPITSGPSPSYVPPAQSPRSGCSSLKSSWRALVLLILGLKAIAY